MTNIKKLVYPYLFVDKYEIIYYLKFLNSFQSILQLYKMSLDFIELFLKINLNQFF